MKSFLSFFLCFIYSINSVYCDDFKCPEKGKVGALKVPNVLSLIDKQNGYRASVEVISPTRKNLIHDYHDMEKKVGYIDLEATIQDKMNRRYYYHPPNWKIVVRKDECKRLDLTRDEKIQSIKDWFEPKEFVGISDVFKDLVHLGPTGLMVYANSISDEASFIGTELIEGRTVNHWFYCANARGPYIDFYFDVKTSLPYRFSLGSPKWIETLVSSGNETRKVKKQVDSDEKYVYNFYVFEALVISPTDPMPYPLGYGCSLKGTLPYTPLPDFGKVKEFTMDMEAVITYSDRDPFKSTARVMKRGDIISYEIKEENVTVRHIEMPLPLGGFEVDEHTGQCSYLKIDYWSDVKLLTRWPYNKDYDFNLLDYLVMKPPAIPTFLGSVRLGPFEVQEYKARNFFDGKTDAFVDYYYTQDSGHNVPSKVIFTRDLSNYYYNYQSKLIKAEVTMINYKDEYVDYADSFDISGCYEEPGNFTWYQLLFSNVSLSEFNMQEIKESTEEYLTSFIPITRIGPIHTQKVDIYIYVTVKLYDRVHFIDAYEQGTPKYTLINPTNIVKTSKVEDCEALCTATEKCDTFSYCSNSDCLIHQSNDGDSATIDFIDGCSTYSWYMNRFAVKPLINENYVSTMSHVLQQIRNRVSSGDFLLKNVGLVAEDLFIVSGPEEIGDISQELHSSGSRPLRAEDFPMIVTDRHFNEVQFKIEKSTLQDCFMACLNDDDCNTLSYCINQNKECILSRETSSSLKDTPGDKTSHADGCNIYQKSFINLFHEYPGKSLVVDAISTEYDVSIADCASTCAQSISFNCESFDYCENGNNRNQSLCFLHVNHIEIDENREINTTNWKFAEDGCSHYSKKSEFDYEHKFGIALTDNMKESIVGAFDHLSLETCASRCNSDPQCFTLEYCEMISLDQISDESGSLSSCTLAHLKPISVNQSQLFEESKSDKKICSIYIKHKKIKGKSKTDQHKSELLTTSTKSNDFALGIGFGAIVFILAFAGGFIGFKCATRKGFISQTNSLKTTPVEVKTANHN